MEGIDTKASICNRDGVSWRYLYYIKKFSGCNGDIQDLDIRTQLIFLVKMDYYIKFLRREKFLGQNTAPGPICGRIFTGPG